MQKDHEKMNQAERQQRRYCERISGYQFYYAHLNNYHKCAHAAHQEKHQTPLSCSVF